MRTTAIAIITILIFSFTTEAQSIKPKSIYAKKMTFEVGGDIFFTSTTYSREENGMSTSSSDPELLFIIDGNAGLFAVDGLKLAVEPAIELRSYGSNSTWTKFKLYFSPEYIFDTKNNVYPYLGGSVGYTSSSYSSSNNSPYGGFSWGAKGGVKVNPFGNALINVGFSYYRETYNYTASYGDVKQHYNIMGIKAGFSVFFR